MWNVEVVSQDVLQGLAIKLPFAGAVEAQPPREPVLSSTPGSCAPAGMIWSSRTCLTGSPGLRGTTRVPTKPHQAVLVGQGQVEAGGGSPRGRGQDSLAHQAEEAGPGDPTLSTSRSPCYGHESQASCELAWILVRH